MSNFTDTAENALVDWFRGDTITLPSEWWVGLVSVASDGSFTELSGAGYARQPVSRLLAAWAGTQGAGTTLASSGTSHTTSNNATIDFGTAGAAWGTAEAAMLFTEETGGDAWMWAALASPQVIDNGDPVSLLAGSLQFSLGLTGGLSDYASNKLIDRIFRGEAWEWPASYWVAYTRTAPTNSTPGSEPVGSSYARAGIDKSFDAWSAAGTPGSTGSSSGTSGRTSNNEEIAWAVPTGNQGTITHMQLMDAANAGNMLLWAPMALPKTLTPGGLPPRFEPDTLGVTFS